MQIIIIVLVFVLYTHIKTLKEKDDIVAESARDECIPWTKNSGKTTPS